MALAERQVEDHVPKDANPEILRLIEHLLGRASPHEGVFDQGASILVEPNLLAQGFSSVSLL